MDYDGGWAEESKRWSKAQQRTERGGFRATKTYRTICRCRGCACGFAPDSQENLRAPCEWNMQAIGWTAHVIPMISCQ